MKISEIKNYEDLKLFLNRTNKKEKNKYKNIKMIMKINKKEYKFDSKGEYERALILSDMEKQGLIKDLIFQKKFKIINIEAKYTWKNNKREIIEYSRKTEQTINYISDFYYFDMAENKYIIEDYKSNITIKNSTYINKRKLLLNYLKQKNKKNIIFREYINGQIRDWEIEGGKNGK